MYSKILSFYYTIHFIFIIQKAIHFVLHDTFLTKTKNAPSLREGTLSLLSENEIGDK